VTDNWRRPWPTVDPTWVLSAQGRAKNYHFFPTSGKPLQRQRHLIELSRAIKIRHSLIVAQTCAGSLSALRFPNIAFPAYVTLSAGVAATPSRKRDNGGKKRGSLGPQPLSANFLQLPHSPPFSPLALCVLRRRCVVGVSVATCCRPCLNQPAGVATSPPGPGSRRTNDAILFTVDWMNST
jgi:hypothetical protein